MTRRLKDLAQELLRLAHADDAPANDDEPTIDEEAIRELARKDAEEMRRARKR